MSIRSLHHSGVAGPGLAMGKKTPIQSARLNVTRANEAISEAFERFETG
jgi:hypothetical protein